MILALLSKNIQNKALTLLLEMRVIFKKEAVSGNIKIENWQKGKQVAIRNECDYNKCMELTSLRHICKESTL